MQKPKTYYFLSLDPVHVGAGGYKLGRVDLSIIRDNITNVPKIPASSLAGTARAFTAMETENKYSCAGRGGDGGEKHCGESDCPVCVTYGFSKGAGNSFQGLAQFYDAHLLLFPVNSMVGPVWVTCLFALGNFGLDFYNDTYVTLGNIEEPELNFGWLMLHKEENSGISKNIINEFKDIIPKEILNKTILVSNKLFSHIVNSNLEVRTSVSIDPETGAAEEKALYTFEAIPRASVFKFDIVYNNPEFFKVNGQEIGKKAEWIKNNVEAGLKLYQTLGIGGMNSRGMGRVRVLNI